MSWVYDYKAGPPGGGLTSLLTYAAMVRIVSEWSDGYRGSDPVSQYVHGEESSPRKFHPAANLSLELTLLGTNAAGVIDHTDGAAGHYYENFSSLKALLTGKQGALVRLQRDAPDHGVTYLDVWQVDKARPTQDRLTYSWPMRAPRPFWVGAADDNNTGATLTVGGDAPVDDMIIDITGTTNTPRLTHDNTGDYVEIDGALPAGGVTIDVGAGTCVRISGGADYSNLLRVNTPWWMELDPGANGVTVSQVSGSPTVSVDWFTKWR